MNYLYIGVDVGKNNLHPNKIRAFAKSKGIIGKTDKLDAKLFEQLLEAALVGVVPFNRDSGIFSGKRYILGGHTNLRKMLYMAALTSIRWCESMKIFYQRLKSKGKPTKVALTAVMRKL